MKLLLLCLLLCTTSAEARTKRSTAVAHAFQRLHACPSTGLHRGKCPGWVQDHRQGLCVGGADTVANRRWMTVESAKQKDKWECKPGWEKRLEECERTGCN